MSQPSDLAPYFFQAPTNVISTVPNPVITVRWGVTNQGSGMATGSDGYWYDVVWFSTNGVLDAQSVDIGYVKITQPLPPAGYYEQTESVTLPLSLSGTYTLFVQVDAKKTRTTPTLPTTSPPLSPGRSSCH